MHQNQRLSIQLSRLFWSSCTFSLFLALGFVLSACQSKEQLTLKKKENVSSLESNQKNSPLKILFLGDSLTEGYGIDTALAYPSLIEARMKKENLPVEVINASISGSTSASALGRLKWQLKSQPDILFLALGANDGLRGIKPESMYKNLAASITLAQKNYITVIVAGMRLPLNYGDDYRKAFENVFMRLAHDYKCIHLDFLLEGVGGKTELNLADGIHPNAKGHEKIAQTVWPVLKKVVNESLAP